MPHPPQDPNQQYPPQHGGYPPAPDAHYQQDVYQDAYYGQAAYAGAPAATQMLGQEDPMESYVRQIENRNKIVSLVISIAVVALLFGALAWITYTAFVEEEVEIAIAATQSTTETKVEKKQFQQSVRQKPSRPSSSPSNTIAASATSPVAVPSVPTDIDSPDLGSAFGTGFGAGGFGDGLGGGMGVPGAMKGRCDSADRMERLKRAGGRASMDRSVLDALRWLKDKQQPDGSWGEKFPVAMTSFALLAYCGHCETVDSPEFGENVKKAIEYLIDVADKGKGMMASSRDRNVSYEHGIAVYALAEAYSLNKNANKRFKPIMPVLKKAVPIIIEGQTAAGGWLYSYGSGNDSDLSVAGWNIQALKAAEYTKIPISGLATAKKKALKMLEAAEDPGGSDGYFKYRLGGGQQGRLSLTGVGLLCSRMLGSPSKLEDDGLDKILADEPKGWNRPNLYAWYYHSQAAFQKQGKHWRQYNDSYQKVVQEAQQKDGSWTGNGGHSNSVGPDGDIYATCLCTLMLEVYYRYLPTGK